MQYTISPSKCLSTPTRVFSSQLNTINYLGYTTHLLHYKFLLYLNNWIAFEEFFEFQNVDWNDFWYARNKDDTSEFVFSKKNSFLYFLLYRIHVTIILVSFMPYWRLITIYMYTLRAPFNHFSIRNLFSFFFTLSLFYHLYLIKRRCRRLFMIISNHISTWIMFQVTDKILYIHFITRK